MENVFALTLLLSLVLFLVGIFSPKASLFWDRNNKPTRKRSAIIYSISFVASFILFGITSNDQNSFTDSTAITSNHLTQAEQSEMQKPLLSKQQLDSIENEKIQQEIIERESQTITAHHLTAAYAENEVKADENFKGKRFFVEGTVTNIKKDILDEIYVILEGDEIFRDVQCYFDDKQNASKLEKGMYITFVGVCDGLMMNVLMKNCELTSNLSALKNQNK